jgi:hypothetical protein
MQQPKFIERAKETHRFHRSMLLANNKWNTALTAKALKRSIGSISEDLLIARWCKTHEGKLSDFDYAYEAIEWIREKEKQQELEDV